MALARLKHKTLIVTQGIDTVILYSEKIAWKANHLEKWIHLEYVMMRVEIMLPEHKPW